MRQAGAALAHALRRGLAEWEAVALLLALNLGVGLLAVLPLLPALSRELGHAPLAEGAPLLSGPVLFAVSAAFQAGGRPSVLGPLLLLGLVQLFLAGGLARRGWLSGPFSAQEFFGASARMFFPNLRLFGWGLLGLGIVAVPVVAVAALLHTLGRDPSASVERWGLGRPLTGWSLAQLVLSLLCFAAWRLALEQARVLMWRDDLRRTRQAAWRGALLAVRAPLAVGGYAVLVAAGVLGVFAVARVRAILPEGGAGWALLALGVGQLALWVRYAFQLAGVAFAADRCRSLTADAAAAPPRAR